MEDKLLDQLLAEANAFRPAWVRVRVMLRLAGVQFIRDKRPEHYTNNELHLVLQLEDKDRIIAKLQPKAKKVKVA